MNRYPRMVCVTVLCLSLGCSHLAQIPVEEELGHRGDEERPWVRIEGFTERDGTRVPVAGLATIRGDSFLVYADEPSVPPGSIPRRLVGRPIIQSIMLGGDWRGGGGCLIR